MEYFLGSVVTLVMVVTVNLLIRSQIKKDAANKTVVRYSQSHIYNLMKPFLPQGKPVKRIKESQALKYQKSTYVRVMVVDGTAYWIKDHTLYTAEMEDGKVNPETTKEVDTMAMDKVELQKMIFVVEQLTEGESNDNGYPGKSLF